MAFIQKNRMIFQCHAVFLWLLQSQELQPRMLPFSSRFEVSLLSHSRVVFKLSEEPI